MNAKHLLVMAVITIVTMAIVQRVSALANIVYPTSSTTA